VSGPGADDVDVDQRGSEISVIARQGRNGFLGTSSVDLTIRATVPLDSRLTTKLGSADVRTEGRLGETVLRSGSGSIQAEELGAASRIATGSGDVAVGFAAAALQVKSGSGDVSVEQLDGPAQVSTGSGDVHVVAARDTVSVKSGSGGLRVREALGDVSMSTASGDLAVGVMHRGQLTARNASGDITVGIPAGVPVWTDISSISGMVRSNLNGAGEPGEGQEFLELRVQTVSGDVHLHQVATPRPPAEGLRRA